MTQGAQIQTEPEQTPVSVPEQVVQEVQRLYMAGRYVDAFNTATAHAPLRQWTGGGPAAMVLAGRLYSQLGGSLRSDSMHTLAWKLHPSSPAALCAYVRTLASRRSPLEVWRFLRDHPELPGTPDAHHRVDWLTFKTRFHARMRDFEAAHACLAQARQADPDDPWVHLEHSHVMELEDRLEDALSSTRRAMTLAPDYPPSILVTARVLIHLGRDHEALELLSGAMERMQSPMVAAHLAMLQTECQYYEEARSTYGRIADLAPLADRFFNRWLDARMADAAYYCGDTESARTHAARAGSTSTTGFWSRFAERLAAPPPDARRVLLPVAFVRQHHLTCAPATLASLGQFWAKVADHLTIAEEICYNGTPTHKQRAWAEDNGWAVRQFTLTWDAAAALIDRGIPFALATVFPSFAHMQAVIGYDTLRGTLLVRDPGSRTFTEFNIVETFKECAPTGPEALVLLPMDRANLMDGLCLPDAELYDIRHRIHRALESHDREAAEKDMAELNAAAPGHRLTLETRAAIARYDGDMERRLEAIDGLRKLYPESGVHLLQHLGSITGTEHRDQRLELLAPECERHDCDPVFERLYAQELADDARRLDDADRLIRLSIRRSPEAAPSYYVFANILWGQRHFDEALELYRFAFCLDDKDEQLARVYFRAARSQRATDEALRLLQVRLERLGSLSSQPARTLFAALEDLDRLKEGYEVLETAMARHPDDGELILFAAGEYGSRGRLDRAEELLHSIRGKAHSLAWTRMAAALAQWRRDSDEALQRWTEVIEAEPFDTGAQHAVARILHAKQGLDAALAHLRGQTARFPRNWELHRLYLHWLEQQESEGAEEVVRQLLTLNANDAWARRELALKLAGQKRFDEAMEEIETARRLEPDTVGYFAVHGRICLMRGERRRARESFQAALRLDVDNGSAIEGLLESCETPAEKRAAVQFIEQQLIGQVIFGDGLLAWWRSARGILEPEEITKSLRAAHQARPDLWHAWSALINHLIGTDRLNEALQLNWDATVRFPLQPALWLDLASIHAMRHDDTNQILALTRAHEIAPGSDFTTRELAMAHDRAGRFEESLALLEQAHQRDPHDCFNQGCLADALWRVGRRDEAIEHLQKAVLLDSNYVWAWNRLQEWARELERPEIAIAPARDLVARRPALASSWLQLCDSLSVTGPDGEKERLEAVRTACRLEPQNVEAAVHLATALAASGDYDAARGVCTNWPGRQIPMRLRTRLAWVEAMAGDLTKACGLVKDLLIEDPGNYWCWYMLYQWSECLEDRETTLEAARQMVRLSPQNADARLCLARVLFAGGERKGAREEFRRAYELDPTDSEPGLRLMDMELEDGNLDAASDLCVRLRRHTPGPYIIAREAQLAMLQKMPEAALVLLEELCHNYPNSEENNWPLEAILDALPPSHLPGARTVIVDALNLAPNLSRSGVLASHWGMRLNRQKESKTLVRAIKSLPRGSVVWLRLLTARLEQFAQTMDVRHWWLVRRYRRDLHAETQAWAEIGDQYVRQGDYRAAARWLSDWKERSDLRPYMLYNHAVSLREVGRYREAGDAGRAALALSPDHTTRAHKIWLATDAAVEGNFDEAESLMRNFDDRDLPSYPLTMYCYLQALLSTNPARCYGSERLRLEVEGWLAKAWEINRVKDRMCWRTIRALARSRGGLSGFMWWLRQHLW